MRQLAYSSFFSGIDGIRAALDAAGLRCVYSCEIDEFCRKVLKARYGKEPEGRDIRDAGDDVPDCDLFVGGFPCQGLSAAGLRKGLADERSGLFFELVRLLERKRPRWFLFENVPGLLSTCSCAQCGRQCRSCGAPAGADDEECQVCGSPGLGGRVLPQHRGTDFFVVLTALQGVGYSVETRILDAQFLGVPQRRRRVFLVGHLGACCPPEILFEPQERGGDPAAGAEARAEGSDGVGGGPSPDRRASVAATLNSAAEGGFRTEPGEHVTCVSNASAPATGKPTLTKSPSGSGRISVLKPEATSEKAHAVSKGTGGGLGGRDGQDDYVIHPSPTAYHRNASCSVTPQGDKSAALKGEGEHSYQFVSAPVAAPLTAGSHPNSNTPGRKREDDENLVAVPGPAPADLAFDAHNTPKTKSGTLTGGETGGGKNEINLPLVARGVPASQPEVPPAPPPKDAPGQGLLFPGADLGRMPAEAHDGRTRVLRLGNSSTDPFVKSDVTDALDTGSGHDAGYASQGVMTICKGSDPISTVDIAQPVTGRRGDPGTVGIPPSVGVNIHGGSPRKDRPEGGMYVEDGADKSRTVCADGASPSSPQGGTMVFQPRHYSRDNECGGKPSHTVALTSQHKSGDSTPHVVAPEAHVIEGDSASSTPDLPSLRTGRGLTHVAFQESQSGCRQDDVHAALDANFGSRRHEGVFTPMTVRRLTPTECERLQGFADGHTCLCDVGLDCQKRRIPPWLDPSTFKLGGCGHSSCGCKCTDSNRYRSLGNSVAVPVLFWIAQRLRRAMTEEG